MSPETKSLSEACTRERTFLDDHFVKFRNNLSTNHPDEAYEAIKPLRSFAQEDPEVQTDLTTSTPTTLIKAGGRRKERSARGSVGV